MPFALEILHLVLHVLERLLNRCECPQDRLFAALALVTGGLIQPRLRADFALQSTLLFELSGQRTSLGFGRGGASDECRALSRGTFAGTCASSEPPGEQSREQADDGDGSDNGGIHVNSIARTYDIGLRHPPAPPGSGCDASFARRRNLLMLCRDLRHAKAQEHGKLHDILSALLPCGVDHDVCARQSVRGRVVVGEVEKSGGGRDERQTVGREGVDLAGHLQAADVAEGWAGGCGGFAGATKHCHIETGVVRHEHVIPGEIRDVSQLRRPGLRADDILGLDAVDPDVQLEEAVVARWRLNEPSSGRDDPSIAYAGEPHRAGRRARGVRRFEIDGGEIQGHVPSVARGRTGEAEARREIPS